MIPESNPRHSGERHVHYHCATSTPIVRVVAVLLDTCNQGEADLFPKGTKKAVLALCSGQVHAFLSLRKVA